MESESSEGEDPPIGGWKGVVCSERRESQSARAPGGPRCDSPCKDLKKCDSSSSYCSSASSSKHIASSALARFSFARE